MTEHTAQELSGGERDATMARAIANQVASGWRVESQTAYNAILVNNRASIVKFGLCLLIWWPGFFFGHHRSERRRELAVDEFGHTLVSDL